MESDTSRLIKLLFNQQNLIDYLIENSVIFHLDEKGMDLRENIYKFEKIIITKALELTKGNKNKASKLINYHRTTLMEKLKTYSKKS